MRRIVMAHGGTASTPDMKDGTDDAAEAGLRAMQDDGPMAAVVAACVLLEDDERFNAGTGSNFLFDGKTIEMDAAVMDSRRRYGAVSVVRSVKNPIRVAHDLVGTPNHILAGEGAERFARATGHERYDPATKRARKRWEDLIDAIKNGQDDPSDNEWLYASLKERWNFPTPFEDVFGTKPWAGREGRARRIRHSDTVGAVATDGMTFAAGTSTGGTITTLMGRIGDTPNIGTGIFAGEFGAIALSGNGDHILRDRAATMLHDWMADGLSPQAAVRRLASRYDDTTDMWAAVIGLEGHAGGGNREIAWSVARG